MTYDEVLSILKWRLMTPPDEVGPHVKAIEYGAALIVGSAPPNSEGGYSADEQAAGYMLSAMWRTETQNVPVDRRFPAFRVGPYDAIVADAPVGQYADAFNLAQWGGHLVAVGFESLALRDFIIAACNAYREPEQAEPEAEAPFLWYAGLDPSKLTHGPCPTRIEAIQTFRADHAVEAFYLVEGRKPVLKMSPFSGGGILTADMLDRIEGDAAGDGAVLPPLTISHRLDLVDALNDAVEAWGKRHGIKLIATSLQPRKVEWIAEVEEPRVPRRSGMCPVVAARMVLDQAKVEVAQAHKAGDAGAVSLARIAVRAAQSGVERAKYHRQFGGGRGLQ